MSGLIRLRIGSNRKSFEHGKKRFPQTAGNQHGDRKLSGNRKMGVHSLQTAAPSRCKSMNNNGKNIKEFAGKQIL